MEGLKPSAERTRPTSIRRATFDLTGLPPTRPRLTPSGRRTGPRCVMRSGERLLASSALRRADGNRLADASRYARHDGYHIDQPRDMWHWPRLVSEAFQPHPAVRSLYGRSACGDLLPGATLDQKIATGFNRNHMINFEGGADSRGSIRRPTSSDRVNTTATVWLGLTMGCASARPQNTTRSRRRNLPVFRACSTTCPRKDSTGRRGRRALLSFPRASSSLAGQSRGRHQGG